MLIIRRLNCIDAASGIVFSVSGRPVHRLRENCCAVLSQLDALYNYNAPTILPAGGRQHRGCIIPQAVTHSLVLLKMGKIIARNMLS